MECYNCGNDVEKRWKFCPGCGAPVEQDEQFLREGDMFGSFEKEFEKAEQMMKSAFKNFEIFDLKPLLRPQKASGFSIVISEATEKEPQISVKTFGDVKKEDIEKRMKMELGVPAKPAREFPAKKPLRLKAMEEPETAVKKTDGSVVVTMKLPGVKSESDVEINQLEESIEVRAFGKERGYFKILSIPHGFAVVSNEFSNGTLRLEIA